jgi:hypothetical protein
MTAVLHRPSPLSQKVVATAHASDSKGPSTMAERHRSLDDLTLAHACSPESLLADRSAAWQTMVSSTTTGLNVQASPSHVQRRASSEGSCLAHPSSAHKTPAQTTHPEARAASSAAQLGAALPHSGYVSVHEFEELYVVYASLKQELAMHGLEVHGGMIGGWSVRVTSLPALLSLISASCDSGSSEAHRLVHLHSLSWCPRGLF